MFLGEEAAALVSWDYGEQQEYAAFETFTKALSERFEHALESTLIDSALALNPLRAEISALKERVSLLEVGSVCVRITTFAPEPYDVIGDIYATLVDRGDSVEATVFDAMVSAAGDNQIEAVANLKAQVLDVFDELEKREDAQLGKSARRQKAVLRSMVKRRGG